MKLRIAVGLACFCAVPGLLGCSTSQASQPLVLTAITDTRVVATAGESARFDRVGTGPAWRLASGANGASLKFSPSDGKPWDLSRFESVRITLRNTGKSPETVRARIASADANDLAGTCQTATTLMPGQSETLDLRIVPTPIDPGFEPFKPFLKYYSQLNVRDNTVNPASIDSLTVWLDEPAAGDAIEVSDLQLYGTAREGPTPFFPFIDKYGQYIHADWPGKIHDDADFAARRAEEEHERADWPGPDNWNRFGGWATGPQLEATGFFRVAKHEGKWWLVDPEGKLFWSYGPTGAGFGPDNTPITDRESWFESLPPRDSPMGKYYTEGKGVIYMYYRDREWAGYQFSLANAERKYGADAAEQLRQITTERLRSWGFNTLGNWSPAPMMSFGKTPYVTPIHFSAPRVNDHLPDVFHPQWEENLRVRLDRERDTTAKDPMNIGYFVDNERRWGKFPRFAGVALQILESPPDVMSKIEFIDALKAKYSSIEKLNESWGTAHASWDAMLQSRAKVSFEEPKSDNMQADCGDFGMRFGEKYFSTCKRLVKAVAPQHMYLGARLHSHIDRSLIELQTKYCDVISYNMYDVSPAGRMKQYDDIDFPFMITEWGIDNDSRQSPFRATSVQVAIGVKGSRTARLTQFAEAAIVHPKIVGAHFFQYRDQPLSGRPDGEALLRGFVNGTDTPNFELVQANRRVAYDLYQKRDAAR
jgi:hypothetical protein